jgi:hypothetical protein
VSRTAVVLASLLLLAACGGKAATPTPGAPTTAPAMGPGPSFVTGEIPSAEMLCQILTPADFAAMNFVNAPAPSAPTVNSDEPGSAYCVYAGDSGASGGLEFDAFVTANVVDAQEAFNVMREGLGDYEDTILQDCEICSINADIDGTFGAIVGRNGRFAFSIAAPADNKIRLETLAAVVLDRSRALW